MGTHGFADIEAGRIHWQCDGNGPPVVLLGGGMLDARLWDSNIDPLAQRYTVVRCDLRGYGRSSLPNETIYRHCDDVRALIDHLGLEEVCIGGQSLCGSIAIDVAPAHPDDVRGLIDHVGHYPNLEDPTLLDELTLGFLDRLHAGVPRRSIE